MLFSSADPRAMYTSLWRNRELIQASTKREVVGRYRGSVMGLLWSFFNPLFMLAIYTFVFSEILKSRWSVGSESKTEFAIVLFIGMMVFNLFSECVNRAPSLIIANANYVKKVVFPLEILPFVALLSAFFHFCISLLVWLFGYIILFGAPPATALYLPLVLPPFLLFTLGLSWALASLGVYMRDISQVVSIATTLLMFLSPIFYPATSVPEEYRQWLFLNPLTVVIEQLRAVLYWGHGPDLAMTLIYWGTSMGVAWLGFAWFQKTRRGFADVI